MKTNEKKTPQLPPLYERIRQILDAVRSGISRTVNTTQVVANWLIGREIVEEEQQGQRRAGYGERLMRDLAAGLAKDYGPGYGLANLKLFRQFYLTYPKLAGPQKSYAVSSLFLADALAGDSKKGHAPRSQSAVAMLRLPPPESWQPGQLHPNLSWTHYRTLVRVDKPEARAFYEIEALKNNWSARELERQIARLDATVLRCVLPEVNRYYALTVS